MMYSFSESAAVAGDLDAIWAVETDAGRRSEWDPHQEGSRLDGPFAPGTKGWVKPKGGPAGPFEIVEVEPGRSWVSEAPIPFGKLRGHHDYEALGDGTVRVTYRTEIHGPMGPLFRLIWEKKMRADMPRTFAALEEEVAARG
ncbi:SRPBCC family protein [Nocardia stercoris]|uniref:SRPBCC family protein n=1 Tax=Nocardia stercoris TaxID=2483361 RepID=A0A3M2KVY5_9NOCA|nr:SRPBCC family protein [Nocardia stercoris]RMI27655.1 hypothetical protein EBN03_33325 [Nocardia stercoris]